MKYFQMTESKEISVIIELEYINTSSALMILRVLSEIKSMIKDRDVKIRWFFQADDKDMREVGKDFKYILGEIIQLETRINKAS